MKITYSGGYPTKASLKRLINNYDAELWRLYPTSSYRYNRCLNWQDDYTQSKVEGFINYATNMGIKFGTYRPRKSPITGQLEILPF